VVATVIGMHGRPILAGNGSTFDGIFVRPGDRVVLGRTRGEGMPTTSDHPAVWVSEETAAARQEKERLTIDGEAFDIVHKIPNGAGAVELVLVESDGGEQAGTPWR
jgi:hypothetical protein